MGEVQSRVVLVGAGFIGTVHADVLMRMPGTIVSAVVDPVIERATALARRCGSARAFGSLVALKTGTDVQIAHVLTPPATHRKVAEPLLRRGINVLLEKPMATSEADCVALEKAAREGGARIAVNHNFTCHPSFVRLLRDVRNGLVGRLHHVDVLFMPSLRQLGTGQLNHWMFRSPLNLLLEQGVHPISQLDALIGPLGLAAVRAGPVRRFGGTRDLVTSWQVVGHGGETSFSLTIDLAASNPNWRIRAVGSDGVLECDVLRNFYACGLPTPWLEPCDQFLAGSAAGMTLMLQAAGNGMAYGLSQIGLGKRSDGFFLSMRKSIKKAHRSLQETTRDPSADGGRRVVRVVERIATATDLPNVSARRCSFQRPRSCEILLVGGTGFIGRHLLARLSERGHRIRVLARQNDGLPDVFGNPSVDLVSGNVTDEATLTAAMEQDQVVVHLAHGGGTDWVSVERSMVGGARTVAAAARRSKVGHLLFASSIAALYLGERSDVVHATSPPDPSPKARGAYARGKIESERLLRELNADEGLPVTVVRPGLVVGSGTSPFHSGLGEFNRETHCLGWNGGTNPLPFVLVSDLVAALVGLIEQTFSGFATHNFVGDVRPTAQEYVNLLARCTGRPLRFRPRAPLSIASVEIAKWLVKRLGNRDGALISVRDIRSRGLMSPFDTSETKKRLSWQPVGDLAQFAAEAFADVA